ncbi:hypothetical protein E3N88_28810 [Mikania micrantha]|uniref:CCHC-type domain-containing protein n=1 Tax=Mikania micrantha TaxID=192012 RepID=A0A5N6N0K0_9ASTR|nr:hypothetical protein E3N88_28810 [Mikania micrantha]
MQRSSNDTTGLGFHAVPPLSSYVPRPQIDPNLEVHPVSLNERESEQVVENARGSSSDEKVSLDIDAPIIEDITESEYSSDILRQNDKSKNFQNQMSNSKIKSTGLRNRLSSAKVVSKSFSSSKYYDEPTPKNHLKDRKCYRCGNFGHLIADCDLDFSSTDCSSFKSFSPRETRKCFTCCGIGHISANCPNNKIRKSSDDESWVMKFLGKKMIKVMMGIRVGHHKRMEGVASMGHINNRWIVYIGCSRHMTGELSLLRDFKLVKGSYVNFAGDKGGQITGFDSLTNGKVSFDNVNFCKELSNNLLSVSQICDKGNKVMFDKDRCYVLKQ